METGDDSGVDGLGHSGIDSKPGGAGIGDTSMNGGNDSDINSLNSKGQGENSICRDYMRNVCTRGKKCKYAHPESKGDTGGAAAALLQDSIVFCHDFQNRNDCSRRQHCRFIHCRKEEEEEFKRSGYLPPHIRDQAITKGVAPDLPALYGARPICKDFLKGDCRRGRLCRFRHLTPRQYDMEMANAYGDYDYGGYNSYEYPEIPPRRMGYPPMEPPMKRRRDYDARPNNGGHNMGPGAYPTDPNAAVGSPDMDMIQHENMLLKSRVEELKKQVTELTTTNNFLLEQNAQLRQKTVTVPQGQVVAMAPPPQPAQPPVSMPPISIEMPMATTSISMAPQQIAPQPHESRIVSYPGRL